MTIDNTRDHGDLWFPPGSHHRTYERREPVKQVVLHWTAGIRGAPGVHQTLSKRGLSVHHVIEPDGDDIQMADWSTRCSHATHLSDTSVGVECTGLGFSRLRPSKFTHRNWPGQTFRKYPCTIDGRTKKCIAFTAAQTDSVIDLCERLCAEFDLPRIYPGPVRVPAKLVRRFARNYRGVLGHYHVHTRTSRWSKGKGTKWDPGTQIFDALDSAGYQQVDPMDFV